MLPTLIAWTVATVFILRLLALMPDSWRTSAAHMAAFASYEAGEWFFLGLFVVLGLLARWAPLWQVITAIEAVAGDHTDRPDAARLVGGQCP